MKKFLTGIFVVLFSVPAFAAENSEMIQISGTVVDFQNNPLYYAYVTDKSTESNFAITDAQGHYTISVPSRDTMLSIGGVVGMDDQSMTADAANGKVVRLTQSADTHLNAAVTTAEQSQAKVQELRENYNTQRAKEQSTTNKLIGAAGIGATGIGAQMAASALAEQRADADAERDMRAYLATFKCDYGAGRNINGGETEIELPGGNDLLPLYTEYRQLANDLKIRKDALGLKPGIESEVIFDAAETGLYDNAATGITSGTYTSLARALTNTTGTDAQNWQAQKDEAAQSLKTGATVAGVGAGASLVANLAVNSGASKQNQAGNIIAKYAPLYKLQDSVTKLSDNESGVKCPDGATGTVPECVCGTSGREYNANTNTCDAPSLEKLPDITSTATTGITGGLAQITTQNALAPRAVLPAKNLFATGKSTLTSVAQQEIKTFVANVKNATDGDSKYCITVTGHTDKTGNVQSNNTLSQNRADAVKQALISSGLASGRIRTVGRGQSECTQDGPQESCRKVEISMSDSEC